MDSLMLDAEGLDQDLPKVERGVVLTASIIGLPTSLKVTSEGQVFVSVCLVYVGHPSV